MEHLLVEDLDLDVEMDSDDPAQSIEIDQLGYTAELDSRTETVNTAIASGTSSKAVTFQHAFFTGTSAAWRIYFCLSCLILELL